MTLDDRAAATAKTLRQFEGRAFNWRQGATCIHLARAQARHMGRKVPRLPTIRSAIRARTALTDMGHDSLSGLIDSLFERIAPARMLVGDIAALPGDDSPFEALLVYDGHQMFFGWHGLHPTFCGITALKPHLIAAWRL